MSAAPAPGEKQAARRPGLRGHHKLYLAAASLVAVCVWLIVWLVVFGKVLPDDIVGFAAVVFQVTVKTGIMALLFARYVAGAGAVVAHKRRWLRRNGRDLGGNDDDDLAYG